MLRMRANIVIKLMLTLCIVMQSVMLFPHHHHPGVEGVCMDVLHCTRSHSDCRDHNGKTCGSHRHDAQTGTCSFEQLVLSQPQREDCHCPLHEHQLLHVADLLPLLFVLPEAGMPEPFATALYARQERQRPFVEPLHIRYITQASLLRAPTRIA